MDFKDIEHLLKISNQVKNSWDHVCFKKCMDTFEVKITPQQHGCLKNCTVSMSKAMEILRK